MAFSLVHLLEVLRYLLAHLFLVIYYLLLLPNEDLDHRVTMLNAEHYLCDCVKLLHVMAIIVLLELVQQPLVERHVLHLKIPLLHRLALALVVPDPRLVGESPGGILADYVGRYTFNDRSLP